jgi:hypothetical protein
MKPSDFKIELLVGKTYEVYELKKEPLFSYFSLVFEGSISDCECFVKMRLNGISIIN